MNQVSNSRHQGRSDWQGSKVFFLLCVLFLGAQGFLQAQSFDLEFKKIDALQDRSAYDSALILANKLLTNNRLDSDEAFALLLSKQLSFYYLGKYDSMRLGNKALVGKIARSSELYPHWLFAKGLLNGEDGGYEEAVRSLKEAEVIFGQRNQVANLAKVYNSLGTNFKELEELNQAKAYYKKGRNIHISLRDSVGVVMSNNNLGSVYRTQNQPDSALFYYQEAARLLTVLDNTFLLAQNQLNIGNIYEQQGDLDAAEAYFTRCLTLSEGAGINYGMLLSRLNLGNLYRLKKEYVKSKDWLDQAFNQANSMGLAREKGYALERLSWLARDTQDFQGAYLLGMDATKIKDSLLSESVKKESLALQERYESEKKANEILLLQSDNQRIVVILFICSIGILVLVILVLLGSYRQKRLLNQKLLSEAQQKNLSNAIEVKDMELTAQALQILQIKKLLDEQRAGVLNEEDGQDASLVVRQETFELLQYELENRITEVNGDFFKNLLLAYPDLKPTELKLCSYLRLNLSTKELADVLNKSVRTVENTRFSIRKKMGLGPEDNLVAQLIAVEEK